MPRLWILSDLHFETIPYPEAFDPARPDFDVLVAAGDIWEADTLRAFRFLRALAGSKPIVFVMGNHEHWNGEINENLAAAKLLAAQSGISLLEESSVDIAGCHFVGATLWSDYNLAGDPNPRAETGEQVDVQHAGGGSHLITVGDARRHHVRSRSRLGELLSQPVSLPKVVVTHHAPHPDCLTGTDRGTCAAGNSASDLSDLTDQGKAALWIHGHVHSSVNIQRPNGTRIICNPAGPLFCNTAFDERLVVLA
ncbi:MAG: metallophosphoesterase [Bosea sp. (in: a-proteobacteria)]|uniref:metallophosphoesterase n=1 Tax=Bosea sp. (in: a-proteobacteria) TaxID=1871050 RepID=UPI003F7C9F18